ncbi:MAG: PQQ-binding-like beta-propeller repeat protein [Planctomycetes bacterium]|nr:PQQ-binding-like beta-propeller repeat protein [Planctomycetota bacterium]
MKYSVFFGAVVLFASSITSALAVDANWPQWRGPNRDDVSQETGLLQSWPEGGPKQVWLFEDCGLGYSGLAIVGNRIYILGARSEKEQLLCLRASDGKELWAVSVGNVLKNSWGNGPRSTPTVDGNLVYALSGQGNLVCCNTKDGSLVWSKTMLELGGGLPVWGFSESPLIHGNHLLCTPGGDQGAVVALEKLSGDLVWQASELTDIAHYSSIVVAEHLGKQVGIQFLVSQLVGIDLEDGSVLWSVPWPGRTAVVPTPIVWGDKIYVSSGYGTGCMMVKMGENHSISPVYDNKLMSNHHGGIIRIDDSLFGYSNKKGWTCQDFDTGEKVWQERKEFDKGSIAYADGRFYCLSEGEGEVVLIASSKEGWEEHGRFRLDPQTELRSPKGRIWTHPVITGGRLYLRDQELLFSFDVQAK